MCWGGKLPKGEPAFGQIHVKSKEEDNKKEHRASTDKLGDLMDALEDLTSNHHGKSQSRAKMLTGRNGFSKNRHPRKE